MREIIKDRKRAWWSGCVEYVDDDDDSEDDDDENVVIIDDDDEHNENDVDDDNIKYRYIRYGYNYTIALTYDRYYWITETDICTHSVLDSLLQQT